MAPKYALSFFAHLRARSEIPRLVFAAAKQDYKFVGVAKADWPTLKLETPYGGLPVLEIDGEKHGQGMAISSFLAAEFGLVGESNMDRFLIEQVMHLREDLMKEEAKHFLETDPDAKAALAKELEEVTYPRFLALFTKALKRNSDGTGFFIGSKLTLGDLALYAALTTALNNFPQVADNFPELLAHRKRIAETDGIKQFVESQPASVI